MKKFFIFALPLTLLAKIPEIPASWQFVDGVIATAYPPIGGPISYVWSDLARRDISGEPVTLRQIYIRDLKERDAERLRVPKWTEEDVKREINKMIKNYRISYEQLIHIAQDMGYDEEEMHDLLRQKHMVEQAEQYQLITNTKLVITKRDIEQYYQEHPEKIPAAVYLRKGTISKERMASRQELDALLASEQKETAFSWQPEFSVTLNELPEELRFVFEKQPGDFVDIEEEEHAWVITQLVKKVSEEIVPLSKERYEEIANKLRLERAREVQQEYEQKLLSNARLNIIDARVSLNS